MRIFVSDPIGQSGLEYLKKCGHTVEYVPAISSEKLAEVISTYDALIVRSRTRVDASLIDRAISLKVIARSGAGMDTIDLVAASQKNIVVVNAPGANAEAVAEHTLALILALARDLIQTSIKMAGGEWSKATYRGMELKGKTLGVVGFGTIGARVVELGLAFGMNVLVFTKTQTPERQTHISALGAKLTDLETLVAESDVVSLHMSLSDETRGLFNASLISKMKPISYLINTSRGAIVDESALAQALTNGSLAGAALDVFSTEPLPATSVLRSLPNVILTPHVAANSKESEERASIMIADDIDRVLQGKPAIRRVTI